MAELANKAAICDTLIDLAKIDRDIVVLTSDSRGSASMTKFADELPEQLIEVGIAEQNLVGIAAGLAASGKKPYIASYAAFLSMRSIEQIKVDVAYSKTNVKVIGISGGLSYGPLGMSHHAVQDIAVMRAIPNLKVIMPADRYESKKMIEVLVNNEDPVYIRVGRNPVPDVYQGEVDFEIAKGVVMRDGSDLSIIACGRMVRTALDSAEELSKLGISCRVINMHTLKPLDDEIIIKSAAETGHIITLEEHSIYGGLGSAVAEVLAQNSPVSMKIIGIPDEPAIAGKAEEVYEYYGLSTPSIVEEAKKLLSNSR
ncbi:transketolase family protein [Iocasia frigidifontis]|uniref:Transketolase family protein n=1 Tax=Iocasia fonsfrigidae TaxID=2682810 RepID=A0A8A7KB74_9FIRM|nr:transketolase C-terminal domain-containing protein [Iocasia fonsfrigidae]QTL98691.1 transketolase family protein [Iocasia fonsfrigidae]